MIISIIGTRAQLIKMAPIINEMERRQIRNIVLMTGQHRETMAELIADFQIRAPIEWLYNGPEVSAISRTIGWVFDVVPRLRRRVRDLIGSEADRSIVVIHGDTFSTLVGAAVARSLGVAVAHVESGLRSHRIAHPFPEELTRRIVFRLTDIAFCPGRWAFDNMQKYRLERIDTGTNTLRDALDFALSAYPKPNSADDYGICSIHRFENIFNHARLLKIVQLIELAAAACPLMFVLHPATRKRLEATGLLVSIAKNPRIRLVNRMGYVQFIGLVRNARFVITDGGGNQEELSYLGIPTLLMRDATERQEGLTSSTVLSRYSEAVVRDFLATKLTQRRSPELGRVDTSPSKIIVDRLEKYAG